MIGVRKIISKLMNFLPAEKYARLIGVKVGKSCRIASRNFSGEPYLITIGNHVQICRGVSFYTHGGGHVVRRKVHDFDFFGKIKVEDWVYVGAFSHIMPGVTIGEGSIVAAGSVVTKSCPPQSVVAGNPARIVSTIDEFFAKNEKFNVHTYGLNKKKKRELLLSLPQDKFIVK